MPDLPVIGMRLRLLRARRASVISVAGPMAGRSQPGGASEFASTFCTEAVSLATIKADTPDAGPVQA
jgi:hypothetical protein